MQKTVKDQNWQDQQALDRYTMIAPLLDESLDPARRSQMRQEISERRQVSQRTLYRYEAAYKAGGFSGLKPAAGNSAEKGSAETFHKADYLHSGAGRLGSTRRTQTLYPGTASVSRRVRRKADANVPGCPRELLQTLLQAASDDAPARRYQVWL